MEIKICALGVCLVLILDSSSLNQINALNESKVLVSKKASGGVLNRYIPFPYEYIYIK